MPRGYMKHKDREVGGKKARGGSSRGDPGRNYRWDYRECRQHSRHELSCIDVYLEPEICYEQDCYCGDIDHCSEPVTCSAPTATIADFLDDWGLSQICSESQAITGDYILDDGSFSFCESSIQSGAESFFLVEDEANIDTISFCSMDSSVLDFASQLQTRYEDSKPCAVQREAEKTNGPSNRHSKCPICLEDKPSCETLRLFYGCEHPPACRSCLHSHYIKHAMKDISNFPLKCFSPCCNRYLRDLQLRRFANCDAEIQAFHHLQAEAKNAKRLARECERDEQNYQLIQQRRIKNLQVLQQCRSCDYATPVNPGRDTMSNCAQCRMVAKIDVMTRDDVRAMVRADADATTEELVVKARTQGDLLVNCPSCCTLIYKDGGCFDMRCEVCHTPFSFKDAKVKMDT